MLQAFAAWAAEDMLDPPDRFFWANNASFDWGFLSSYLYDYEIPNPFNFRKVRDIRCFLEGNRFPEPVPAVEVVSTDGMDHNALHDCIKQIDWLFKAMP